jgi:uncharacterized protein (TIGR02246 family)
MTLSSADDVQAEVREASARYFDTLRRLDHEAASSMFAEDALLMPPGGPDLAGGVAIHAMMAEAYPPLRFIELELKSTEIEVRGDLAFEVTHYDERVGMPDGTDVEHSGRFLVVWRRESSGEWRILRGMYNHNT